MKEQIADELHNPLRWNFKLRKVITYCIDDFWQADLVKMLAYSKFNEDYKIYISCLMCFPNMSGLFLYRIKLKHLVIFLF